MDSTKVVPPDVVWFRTLDGAIDWDEMCCSHDSSHLSIDDFKYDNPEGAYSAVAYVPQEALTAALADRDAARAQLSANEDGYVAHLTAERDALRAERDATQSLLLAARKECDEAVRLLREDHERPQAPIIDGSCEVCAFLAAHPTEQKS